VKSTRIQLLLVIVAFSSGAFAADEQQKISQSASSAQSLLSQSTIASADLRVGPYSSLSDSREPSSADAKSDRKATWHIPLNAANDICYTVRMYKVKATERLSDSETGMRGYSTCQFARDYQVRSVDAQDESSLETRSRLK
jgi:hypothetical protein